MMDVQSLQTIGIWTALVAIILGLALGTSVQRLPPTLAWAGKRNEVFGSARACIREYTAGLTTMLSGYRKFSKRGQPFVMPGKGFDLQVMLPQEHIEWLTQQPDEILSHREFQGEKLGLKYLLPAFDFTSDMALIAAIRVHLTRNLSKVQGDLVDGVKHSVDTKLGLDCQEWKEINLYDTMNQVVFQASGRILFGNSLCRNEAFLRCLVRFSTWFGVGVIITGQMIPRPLRRLFGFLLAIPTAYYRTTCANYLWPLFVERFQDMQKARQDPTFEYTPPEDLITWMFRAAFELKDYELKSPKPVASRFTVLLAGAISTSVVTTTNTFLDLLGSDPELKYYEMLREEAESVLATEEDWTKSSSLLKLHRFDSTIRESLRYSPAIHRGLSRQVMPKEGVTLPNGQHIPQGVFIGVPVPAIHSDERFYDEPNVYNPFRFVPTATTKKTMLVTTSHTFLPFGHARHSCPGRWFASHLLKLLLAYITINYDIEPLKERPLNMILGDHPVPPPQVCIRVRRRNLSA